MSTVAPIALNGDLFIFYRTNDTNLQGLQFDSSSKTWVVIYAAANDFPADSVPVPVADTEGGILVFFLGGADQYNGQYSGSSALKFGCQ